MKPAFLDPNYDALEDPANAAFSQLLDEDNMKYIGDVCVDSGQIELGDVGNVHVRAKTTSGDAPYPVYQGNKYLCIPIDFLDHMIWSEQLNKWCEENPEMENEA